MRRNRPAQPKADIIFVHGNVYTGVVDDIGIQRDSTRSSDRGPRRPHSGRRRERRDSQAEGAETQVVDLGGKFRHAGIQRCARYIWLAAAAERLNVNLAGVKSLDEFRATDSSQGGDCQTGRMDSGRRLGRESLAGEGSAHALGRGRGVRAGIQCSWIAWTDT